MISSSTGILTIDLSAIQSNWRYVAARLRDGADCAAVVKANAYGVGAVEVTKALYSVGCRHFYVVTLHEAVELRRALPADAVLYVLGGVPDGMDAAFVDNSLIPVLYSPIAIAQWLSFCELNKQAFPCALKINTGMTRLGLDDSELELLFDAQTNKAYLNPVLLMSHLACADEPEHFLNLEQLKRFTAGVIKVQRLYPHIKLSLANSSGTFLGEDYHFDMVRIGAALYGINPHADKPNPLAPVIHLRLPVLQIRTTERLECIGYGATTLAAAGARLAVVAGGYADGIHRTLGIAPRGWVNGVELNAVGRVSMDSCVFDITALPDEPAYIEVINEALNVDSLMLANKTLGYEVLTSLGRRYQRRYIYKEAVNG